MWLTQLLSISCAEIERQRHGGSGVGVVREGEGGNRETETEHVQNTKTCNDPKETLPVANKN